jgi:hypothetical protein
VIGTFDAVGPDEGRFAPFWRFAARGRDVLTVRRPDRGDEKKTTLPVVVNVSVLRDFMMGVQEELTAQGGRPYLSKTAVSWLYARMRSLGSRVPSKPSNNC